MINILLKAVLFVLLVPGVVLSIPKGAPLETQALVHGLVFAVANYLVYVYVRPMLERFDNPDTRSKQTCPEGYKSCPSGECILESDVHTSCF